LKEGQWSSVLVIALSITAVMLSVYFIYLRYAYQKAPIALVYPIARSSALLIALWSLLFF